MIAPARCSLALWIFAACGGGAPAASSAPAAPAAPAGAPAATCSGAIEHLIAVTSAQEEPRIREIAAKVLLRRCEGDAWAEPIRRCLLDVKAPPDADRCEKQLTSDQQLELSHDLARELEAAGVPPRIESGKGRRAPSPPSGVVP